MARKVVFVGATKGMGRALARKMAAHGDRLFLLGRDLEDLRWTAADLSLRGGRTSDHVHSASLDLEDPSMFEAALEQADATLDGFDTLIITAGMFAVQDQLEADPAYLARLLAVNFTNTVLLCEAARKRLLARGGGTLCVFSSVAGDRGRKPVVLYGASKAGLSAYLEGLDHKFHAEGLRTICVKPGFVHTSMTSGLKPPPFAGDPEGVADRVLAALDRGAPVVYAPATWRWIMAVIRNLPRFAMRRVGF